MNRNQRLTCIALLSLTFGFSPASTFASEGGGNESAGESWFSQGFQRGNRTLSVQAGGHYGMDTLGSLDQHHMAVVSASYGYMFAPVFEQTPLLRGNVELRGELFGGWQFSPEDEWLIGLTPHLRYNFNTRSRWVPFFDGGAGLTGTTIQEPDLSRYFQFNLQIGIGLHYFVSSNLALTAEAKYMHLSCAGISLPNRGVNGVVGLLGVTWLY